MNPILRTDAESIIHTAITAVLPDRAVQKALGGRTFSGRIFLVAVGKAAWQMAAAALRCLQQPIEKGVVVTKYGHVQGKLENLVCYEGGHPVPDENGLAGTAAILELTKNLDESDTVLFLLSGGGSALFEQPLVPNEELQDVTRQLLACGADIIEMNTIRKRLSAVKGGRFAAWCAPAHIEAVILSDILGDPLDMIASGPVVPDTSTCAQAEAIAKKYSLVLSDATRAYLSKETPKELHNVHTQVIGSVRELCRAAEKECRARSYEPILLTDQLCCEAREAGSFFASILRFHAGQGRRLAFLAGGETMVHLHGKGMGGRNQELALAAVHGIAGLGGAAIISVGSDGTDGPTDAAGGYADGDTMAALRAKEVDGTEALAQNDAYHALRAIDGLIFTGPTGTNVNDIVVALLES